MASADRRDIRSEVSVEAHAVLLAEERATGKSLSEQVRELIEAHAAVRIHAAKVLTNLLRGNGDEPEDNGTRSSS